MSWQLTFLEGIWSTCHNDSGSQSYFASWSTKPAGQTDSSMRCATVFNELITPSSHWRARRSASDVLAALDGHFSKHGKLLWHKCSHKCVYHQWHVHVSPVTDEGDSSKKCVWHPLQVRVAPAAGGRNIRIFISFVDISKQSAICDCFSVPGRVNSLEDGWSYNHIKDY